MNLSLLNASNSDSDTSSGVLKRREQMLATAGLLFYTPTFTEIFPSIPSLFTQNQAPKAKKEHKALIEQIVQYENERKFHILKLISCYHKEFVFLAEDEQTKENYLICIEKKNRFEYYNLNMLGLPKNEHIQHVYSSFKENEYFLLTGSYLYKINLHTLVVSRWKTRSIQKIQTCSYQNLFYMQNQTCLVEFYEQEQPKTHSSFLTAIEMEDTPFDEEKEEPFFLNHHCKLFKHVQNIFAKANYSLILFQPHHDPQQEKLQPFLFIEGNTQSLNGFYRVKEYGKIQEMTANISQMFLFTSKNKLLFHGSNNNGLPLKQQSSSHQHQIVFHELILPTMMTKLFKELKHHKEVTLSSTLSTNLFVLAKNTQTEESHCFCIGSNTNGELGLGHHYAVNQFTEVNISQFPNRKITSVQCSGWSSFMLLEVVSPNSELKDIHTFYDISVVCK